MKKISLLALSIMLLASCAVYAQTPTVITYIDDNATRDDQSKAYVLNEGEYSIGERLYQGDYEPTINIAGSSLHPNLKIDKETSKLFITEGTKASLTVKDLIVTAGTLEVIGSSANNYVYRVEVQQDLIQDGTSFIRSTGGERRAYVHGIQIMGDLTQNGAAKLEALGGKSQDAYGINLMGNLEQNGSGQINVKGGSGIQARGIHIWGGLLQNGEGTIDSEGSDKALGIWVGSLTQKGDGTIAATGGTGSEIHGMYIDAALVQSGAGTIVATGGDAEAARGIHIKENITQSGAGLLKATGGSAIESAGIFAENVVQSGSGTIEAKGSSAALGLWSKNLIQSADGTIVSTGGTGSDNAHGMYINALVLQSGDGTIVAKGGDGDVARGIHIGGDLHQSGLGLIKAIGGSAEETQGIYAADVRQSGAGVIEAEGGSQAVGIFLKNLVQEADGVIVATGGEGASGIHINEGASISGQLYVARNDQAASIYVGSQGDKFIMKSGSLLVPIIDFKKDQDYIGLIYAEKDVEIENNVTMRPLLKNTFKITKNNSFDDMVFIVSESNVTGKFEISDTITIAYDTELVTGENGEEKYVVTATRYATPEEAFKRAKSQGENISNGEIAFVAALYEYLIRENDPDNALIKYLEEIDNSFGIGDALETIDEIKPSSEPNWRDISLKLLSDGGTRLSLARDNSLSPAKLWVDCFVELGEIDIYKANLEGVSVTAMANLKQLSLGFYASFVHGQISNELSSTNILDKGLIIGGGYIFNTRKVFSPQLWFSFGYSSNDINIRRTDVFEENHISKTNQVIFKPEISLSNKFYITDKITITPQVGFNYTYVRMNGYSETNKSGMSLEWSDSEIHFVQPNLGAMANFMIADEFLLSVNFNLGYKLHFKNSYNSTVIIDLLNGIEVTEEVKNAFVIGAGAELSYEEAEKIKLTLGYSFGINGDYMSHQVKLGGGISF